MVMFFDKIILSFFFFLSLIAIQVEQPPLELDLSRRVGTSIGARIGGRFELRAIGPDDLVRVEFLLDDQVIGEDSAAPFSLTFNTYDYGSGTRTLRAVGYTAAGETLQSNTISRQFLTQQSSNNLLFFILGAVLLFTLARFLFMRNDRRGYGFLGGTICPHCGRPYAIHAWSVRLIGVRLDRCPHCRRWAMIRPASAEALAQAEAMWNVPDERVADTADEQDANRRRLDDSRFEDI